MNYAAPVFYLYVPFDDVASRYG